MNLLLNACFDTQSFGLLLSMTAVFIILSRRHPEQTAEAAVSKDATRLYRHDR